MSVQQSLHVISVMTKSGNKDLLRIEMKNRRAGVCKKEKQEIDQQITQNVISSPCFKHAQTVFVYCSTADEIDTYQIISAGLRAGKTICVPRCEKERGLMTARQIASMNDLVIGKFGISEPLSTAEMIFPESIDLCIVPCLTADYQGYRLGYGGGYYDRFLSRTSCRTAVLCAESRLLREIPKDFYDIPCDYIFTERRILIRETY